MLFSQTVWFVNGNATGANNGTNWDNAFLTIEDAVNAANAGDEIWVSYTFNYKMSPTNDKSQHIIISKNLALYGGFAGTESTKLERSTIFKTAISGDIGIQGDQSDNSYTAFRNTSSLLLDGFRFFFFNSDNASATSFGIIISDTAATTTLRNCDFDLNKGGSKGTSLSVYKNSQTSLLSCAIFSNNTSGTMIAYRDNAKVTIEQSKFQNNGSNNAALPLIYGFQNGLGNVYAEEYLISVRGTEFSGNKGGYFYSFFGSAQFFDCDFYTENSMSQSFYLNSNEGNFKFDSSYFTGTFPNQFIYSYTKTLRISNSTLNNGNNNTFSLCYFSGQESRISNCNFNNLRGSNPIYLYASKSATIEKTNFNTGNASSYFINVNAPKCYLTGNVYKMISSSLGNYIDADSMFIKSCTFENLTHIPTPLNYVTFSLIDSSVFQYINISQPLFYNTNTVVIKNTTIKSGNQSPVNPGAAFILANWGGDATLLNSHIEQLGTSGDLISNSGKLVVFGSIFKMLTPAKSVIQNSKDLYVYNCNFVDMSRPVVFNDTIYSSGDKSIKFELVNSIVYSSNDSLIANNVRPGFYNSVISNCVSNRLTLAGSNISGGSTVLYEDFYGNVTHPLLTDLGRTIPDLTNYSVFDIEGNNRLNNQIDIGAIEFAGTINSLVAHHDQKNSFFLHPNPTIDLVNVEVNENGKIEIFDYKGQRVLEHLVLEGTNAIDLQNLSSGVYKMRISSGTSAQMVSVLKL
ncbi:MAG: T9SS type A sorting domain-containing protein [Cytophagaceae bacterium]|nr:T9SS type A sorting domain-containing protein [Cytophagaceae bacterium]